MDTQIAKSLFGIDRSQAVYVKTDLQGLEWMQKLPGGQLLSSSKLDLDTDGIRRDDVRYESTHQDQTSLDPDAEWIDSNETPYIVLPGGFGPAFGIRLGDLAAVLYRDRLVFAVYADVGPRHKFGEGSIALHRALGFERLATVDENTKRVRDVGIESGVVMLIFPGSGSGDALSPADIQTMGAKLFAQLGGRC